jgi:UDP-N-acetylmuramate dehydrogenase
LCVLNLTNQKPAGMDLLERVFGKQIRRAVPLARYTAARLGGPAEVLLEVRSVNELAQAVSLLWEEGLDFILLGGGSNVLVSDAGIRGVVLLNRSRKLRFDAAAQPPTVWAESGANLGLVARQAALQGLSGLEWAAGIPGTVGGAVYGNTGAHGGDMAGNLLVAEILHCKELRQTGASVREQWGTEKLEFSYRSSVLKRSPGKSVILAVLLRLQPGDPSTLQAELDELVAVRRKTQPPGASMGSMFKNPPGDYAGRLIEAAGLKGLTVGGAQISSMHANFFLNLGRASAADVAALIRQARQAVFDSFGIELELEIEMLGEW